MPDSQPSPGLLQRLLSRAVPSTPQIAQQAPVNPDTGLSAGPSPNMLQRMVNMMGMNSMGSSQPMSAQPTTQVPPPGTPEWYEYMQKRPLGTQGVKRSMFDFLGR